MEDVLRQGLPSRQVSIHKCYDMLIWGMQGMQQMLKVDQETCLISPDRIPPFHQEEIVGVVILLAFHSSLAELFEDLFLYE